MLWSAQALFRLRPICRTLFLYQQGDMAAYAD